MKITRDLEYRRHLIDQQRARLGTGARRKGIHVSDLVPCVRKAWAERVTEHVPEISDKTVLTWMRGLSHESLAGEGIEQVRAGYCFACKTRWTELDQLVSEIGWYCPDCGDSLMVGTIDWITFDDAQAIAGQSITDLIPVEMKSTLKSSRKTLEDGDMAWYLDQIKSYMFIHSLQRGRIAILHLLDDYARHDKNVRDGGPGIELRVYLAEWDSHEEREAWGEELRRSKELFEGDSMPPLDEVRSPRHGTLCDYCIVGERLPDGTQCEQFPWTREGIRKGTTLAKKYTMEEMVAEIHEMQQDNGIAEEASRDAVISRAGEEEEALASQERPTLRLLPSTEAPFSRSPERIVRLGGGSGLITQDYQAGQRSPKPRRTKTPAKTTDRNALEAYARALGFHDYDAEAFGVHEQ